MNLPIEKDTVLKRINGIQNELVILRRFGDLPLEQFSEDTNFAACQLHMQHCLQGVLNISSHILSRVPGAQATTYKEVVLKLGELGIIEPKFAKDKLEKMAGYRNRLVHLYAEIGPEELYDIVQNHLEDFEIFLSHIKKVLERPEKFSLTIE